MRSYHDLEWGRPVADDGRLFEKLSLEGFLSGLSWLTILRKRENFRRAFRSFDIDAVARFNQRSVARLMADAGIVRNRAKIEADREQRPPMHRPRGRSRQLGRLRLAVRARRRQPSDAIVLADGAVDQPRGHGNE